MRIAISAALVIAVAACQNVTVHPPDPPDIGIAVTTQVTFKPYSAQTPGPALARTAVRFYEGDRALVEARNAKYIGDVEVDVHGGAEPITHRPPFAELANQASIEAAARGGTHFIFFVESDGVPEDKLRHARFTVFRLEPVEWAALPQALRPTPVDPPPAPPQGTVIAPAPSSAPPNNWFIPSAPAPSAGDGGVVYQ